LLVHFHNNLHTTTNAHIDKKNISVTTTSVHVIPMWT